MSNIGKPGEELFKRIMGGRNYSIEDVRDVPFYQCKDIDFVLTSPTSGLTKTFEVKWDYNINHTGNLFLEIANSKSVVKGKGWYEFCEADYLAYGNTATKEFYIIPLLELKKRVNELPYRSAICGRGESIGRLVSLNDIKDIIQTL